MAWACIGAPSSVAAPSRSARTPGITSGDVDSPTGATLYRRFFAQEKCPGFTTQAFHGALMSDTLKLQSRDNAMEVGTMAPTIVECPYSQCP